MKKIFLQFLIEIYLGDEEDGSGLLKILLLESAADMEKNILKIWRHPKLLSIFIIP